MAVPRFLRVPARLVVIALLLTGCGAGDGNKRNVNDSTAPERGVESSDVALRALINSNGLRGDPSIGRDIPSIESPLAQLGMKLFFSKGLGGDQDAACVTCHHPTLGGGDRLSLPIGVAAVQANLLGPGRMHRADAQGYDGGPTVPRNAGSVLNLAMWDSVLFWDGRIESLGKTPLKNGADGLGVRTPDTPFGVADPNGASLPVAQAGFPVTSREEMRGFVFEAGTGTAAARAHLTARIGNYGTAVNELPMNSWEQEFRNVFGGTEPADQLITFGRIAEAIAAYQRSLKFVNSPWRAYVQGDDNALRDDAKRGAVLFYSSIEEGGANCVACHSGDFFTDEAFYAIGVPQIGRGKGDGPFGDDDYGRFRESRDPQDMYAFRTPTLLNVTETGPWGHSGAFTTLEGIVRYHLDPVREFGRYDYGQLAAGIKIEHTESNTRAALAKLASDRASGIDTLQNVNLSDGQVADLLAFLESLTDPCLKNRQCLAPWIPDDFDSNPDASRLFAFDQNGDRL